MNKNSGKSVVKLIVIVVIIGLVALFGGMNINAPAEFASQYNCDVNLVSLRMDVSVDKVNGDGKYNISGEILSKYEDNLTMKVGDEVVKTAKDDFNLISQNNHIIMSGDETQYVCDGKIKILADSYDVYDAEGNKIAFVDFNLLDTVGVMKNIDGVEIARYDSGLLRYDYVVSIFDGCEIDDESVLMIFASYFSDKRADAE